MGIWAVPLSRASMAEAAAAMTMTMMTATMSLMKRLTGSIEAVWGHTIVAGWWCREAS
jgi:hypothetical protein